MLVEVSALVVQLFVFLRIGRLRGDDRPARLHQPAPHHPAAAAALGAPALRRRSAAELAATPERDLAVARWYRFVHVAGLAVAAWFFVAFFVPTTLHLLAWMRDALVDAGPTHAAFYQALVLGILLQISPILAVDQAPASTGVGEDAHRAQPHLLDGVVRLVDRAEQPEREARSAGASCSSSR